MKFNKRLLTFVLCIAFVASLVTTFYALSDTPNVTLSVNETEISVGETFTVTLGLKEAKLASLVLGCNFDNALIQVENSLRTSNCADLPVYAFDDIEQEWFNDEVSATAITSKAQANSDGRVAITYAYTYESIYYQNDNILTITFKAIAPGTVSFEVFEDSDSEDGYKGTWTAEQTITINAACDHSSTKLVPNNDGTHDVVCSADGCDYVVTDNVGCSPATPDDGDCTTAEICACTNVITAAKAAHVAGEDDGDCTTAVKCVNCNKNAIEAKAAHVAGEDDGDCTTAVKCENCDKNAIEAKAAHVAGEDDGDCTTAVKCVNCDKNAIEAEAAHVAGEDDGDCTTAVKCVNCNKNAIEAKAAHVAGEDDGDCTTAVKCVNCNKNAIEAKAAHVAGSDDGDCTTAVKCENCDKNAIEAKAAHVAGSDDGDCTTAVKCENCDKNAIEAKAAHVAGEDDGDCTTAVKCVNCDKNAVEAKDHHTGTYTIRWDMKNAERRWVKIIFTCNNPGCGNGENVNSPLEALVANDGVVTTPTSCLAPGVRTYTYDLSKITLAKGWAWENFTGGADNTLGAEPIIWNAETKIATAEVAIAQLDHSYTGEIKSDGNGKDATHSFKCVNGCGGYGNAETHSWNNGVENPVHDCLSEGTKTYTCTVDGCGATYTEKVPASGHSFGEIVAAQNATCEAAGNVAYKQCTVCEKYFAAEAATNATDGKDDTTTFAIAQLDHSYTGTSKNNNDGTHSFKCVNGCNQYGDVTPHNFDNAAFTCICGEKFSGIYTDSADGNIYYIENGVKVQNKGLVKVVNNGHIHYYYFGCGVHDCSEAAKGVCAGEYAAQKNNRHWAENTNGLLLKGAYNFGADGVLEHLDDTSVNGISEVGGKKYYFIDGVKVHKGLFKDGNDYYYARSNGELVVNAQYYISKVNDTGYAEGPYSFDAEGKMVMANASGIVAEDGSLYYYENGVRTYAGLIEISGTFNGVTYDKDLIYVRTSGELAVDRNYWITKTNNLRPEMSYAFDADGKMVDAKKNGIVAEDGALYYYENGVRAYRGLMRYTGTASNGVKYNNALIYVRSNGQLATGGYWTTKHNGLAKERLYQFDANGVMIDADKNGIYTEDGSLFYYENGVRTYAGLIKIEDAYYYVRTSGEVVHGKTYWITKTNGEMKEGSYTFDEDGKMVIK